MSEVVFHVVQPGDTLFGILRQIYGKSELLSRRAELVAYVRANNPKIKDIDLIRPGQIIKLPRDHDPSASMCQAPQLPESMTQDENSATDRVAESLGAVSREEMAMISTFGTKMLTGSGTHFVDEVGRVAKEATPHVQKIVRDYIKKNYTAYTGGQ
ncbi:MAG: LysM peptidoglycan-binding domain-containing protein [Pseudomonadota bacterium]